MPFRVRYIHDLTDHVRGIQVTHQPAAWSLSCLLSPIMASLAVLYFGLPALPACLRSSAEQLMMKES